MNNLLLFSLNHYFLRRKLAPETEQSKISLVEEVFT